jgi:signal transduction histidine kinase
VLKHAGAGRADINLTYAPGTLTLRVTDDGAGPAPEPGRDGHGLIGMTERARLYQGTITTGSRPQGGYEVLATFPLSPSEEDERI